MASKELLPLIRKLKRWRQRHGLSQSAAVRSLQEAGIPVTLDSLQAWEIGRWHPRAAVALALDKFLRKRPKKRESAS